MWSNGKRCAVQLGLDYDAEFFWTAAGMTSPTPQSRGHYGARVGVPRIPDLLDKHRARATFFVPADTARRHPEVVRKIHARGHQVGQHGDLHESPEALCGSTG